MRRPQDQQALLSQEEAPILSDGTSFDEAANAAAVKKPKKKGWRSWFQKKPKEGERVASAGRSKSAPRPSHSLAGANHTNGNAPSNNTRSSAPLRRGVNPRQQQRQPPEKRSTTETQQRAESAPRIVSVPSNQRSASAPRPQRPEPNLVVAASQNSKLQLPDRPLPHVPQVIQRPFGRQALNPSDQNWIVQVSPPEWDADQSSWKYQVQVQQRVQSAQEEILERHSVLRSLSDFDWLQQHLQAEFHGAMLIPDLAVALGIPHTNCQHEVDPELLAFWLTDVLNGVRGQGEWRLSETARVDTSESMEAFLYRTDLLPVKDLPNSPAGGPSDATTAKTEASSGLFSWDMCGLGSILDTEKTAEPPTTIVTSPVAASPSRRIPKFHLPINKQRVSSKAIADARSLHIQNSFVEASSTFDAGNDTTAFAKYTHILQAQQNLIWTWRTRALHAMEKIRLVNEHEKAVGMAWKRFAVDLNSLFAYEKDLESARIGDSKSRKDLKMPYRKLQKSVVDDVLKIMSKQKLERSTPGWEMLAAMLRTYVADLSAVQPAMDAYHEGIDERIQQAEKVQKLQKGGSEDPAAANGVSLTGQIQAGFEQVKKQLVDDANGGKAQQERQQQELVLQMMDRQFQANETLFHDHMNRLCKTVPVRTARMAYGYALVESKECAAVRGAAVGMKTKTDIVSHEVLAKMMARHQQEDHKDSSVELSLVHRMVNLGNTKRFSKTDDGGEEVESGVEISKDEENEKALQRDRALNLCRERIGRWDSAVAMSIMESVGVSDANVRVEETTRDLRLVRKHAIGLREHVQRCTEALEALKVALQQAANGNIRELRNELVQDLQTLFSGSYQPMAPPETPPDIQALIEAGISLSDPLFWKRNDDGCGGALSNYMDLRDSSGDWLMTTMGEILQEYVHRVETVESFVYMECVGIQLEKHFSHLRATALASFEKKTDITSAINIATRKRMTALVKELQAKLELVGENVSHTTVKESKEAHLESKTLKQELHDLAMRRLNRAREMSTQQIIAMMSVWAEDEVNAASTESRSLQEFAKVIEMSIGPAEWQPYVDAMPVDA
eukprot:Nitzschia sp. Nitz4//scaffold327_size20599//12971//16273//NITZ4_008636-RA/size20599-augustus-gene-0.5-mRNA-1//-1//CDS//3329547946//2407//frame0